MRRRPVLPALATVATVVAALVVGVVAPTAAHGVATAQCTYTPKLPALVVVNKPTLNFYTPVTITHRSDVTANNCAADFSAGVFLAHGSDRYYLSWQYNSRTSSDAIYATTVKPGVYRTLASTSTCGTHDHDNDTNLTCAVGAGSTTFKFSGGASLSATRLTGSKARRAEVRFTARARHYDPDRTAYVTTTIAIQRYSKHAWHTIHTATAKGSKGYVWTYTDKDAASYRAVSTATAGVLSGTSKSVTR